jgi:hypothetical protein
MKSVKRKISILWLSDCFLECKINNLVQVLYSYIEKICRFVSVDELVGCAPLSYTATGLSDLQAFTVHH